MGLLDFIWKRGSHTQDPLELVPDENDRNTLATLVKKQRVVFVYNVPGKNLLDVAGFFRKITPQGKIIISREQERHCERAFGVKSYNLEYVHSVSNLSYSPFVRDYDPLKMNDRRKE